MSFWGKRTGKTTLAQIILNMYAPTHGEVENIVISDLRRMFDDAYMKQMLETVGLCKLADRIVLMKNGEICEMGSHGELMEMDGEYKRLFTEQEQWYR